MNGMQSHPVAIVAVLLGLSCAAILPTCVYLYVEPRGRLNWATPGDSPERRRAPVLVRVAAWTSLAMGQLALPWLAVPIGCGALIYLQAQLGILRPAGLVVSVLALAMSLAEVLVSVGLWPLGIRLLVRGERLADRVRRRARLVLAASAATIGTGGLVSWLLSGSPRLVHPWLRAVLERAAIWPIEVYAAVCLVHAIVLGQCLRVLADHSAFKAPTYPRSE